VAPFGLVPPPEATEQADPTGSIPPETGLDVPTGPRIAPAEARPTPLGGPMTGGGRTPDARAMTALSADAGWTTVKMTVDGPMTGEGRMHAGVAVPERMTPGMTVDGPMTGEDLMPDAGRTTALSADAGATIVRMVADRLRGGDRPGGSGATRPPTGLAVTDLPGRRATPGAVNRRSHRVVAADATTISPHCPRVLDPGET
jgi:hypothetical protein